MNCQKAWGHSSVVQPLPTTHKALNLIPSTGKQVTRTTSEWAKIFWKEKLQTFLSKQAGNKTNEGILELLKHPTTSLCGFVMGARQTEAARQHPVCSPPPPFLALLSESPSTLTIQHCWVCLKHLITSLSRFGIPLFQTNQPVVENMAVSHLNGKNKLWVTYLKKENLAKVFITFVSLKQVKGWTPALLQPLW